MTAAEKDALELLRGKGIPVRKVVWVEPDSIGFVSPEGLARTAWLKRRLDGKLRVRIESGFQAVPNKPL